MKKCFLRMISLAISLALVVSVAGIQIFAAKTGLNKTSLKMVPGVSYTLKLNGVSGKVSWSSSDKSVAAVNSSGKVTSVAVGSAVITAKSGKKSYKCTVEVVTGSITLDKSSVTIKKGDAKAVTFTVKGTSEVKCVSLDKNKVVVLGYKVNGDVFKVKIKGLKPGTAYVKVYLKEDKTISKKIKVTVTDGTGTSGKTSDSTTSSVASVKENKTEQDSTASMSYAEQVLYYVNIERENAGVSPLTLDDKLCQAADIRAAELLELFSHTRPDGTDCFTVLDEVDFSSSICGENIAAGRKTAKETVNDWMNSPGHKANILNPSYSVMGAARAYSANTDYGYYWAQLFG